MTDNIFPSPSEFFVETSLYRKFEVGNEQKHLIFGLFYFSGTIDCYCIDCKRESVFNAVNNHPTHQVNGYMMPLNNYQQWNVDIGSAFLTIEKNFKCNRGDNHIMQFFIMLKNGELSKIGQSPSLADLSKQHIKDYKGVLNSEGINELNKAWGLYSHGSGVGSFVYLRRIVEIFIIKPAHDAAKLTPDWDEEQFMRLRVGERIKLLKASLPKFLVENPSLYGIISKGIHELTEQECLEYFPLLNTCLEFILTELKNKKESERKMAEVTAQLSKLAAKHK